MAKKKSSYSSALVYSTDQTLKLHEDKDDNTSTLPADMQVLKVTLDKKQRAGKVVTLITGFSGRETDLEQLSKELKAYCGTGGSCKNGEIIIQGDNKEKVFAWLQKRNYKQAKKV